MAADLLRVVEVYPGVAQQRSRFLMIILTEIPRHPELSQLVDPPLNVMQRVDHLLTRCQSEGLLAPEPPFQAVAALLGPLIMMSMWLDAVPAPMTSLDLPRHVDAYLHDRLST